jgi:hypothetical protein
MIKNKTQPHELPSRVNDSYWLSAEPPSRLHSTIMERGFEWLRKEAEKYVQSGKIYPRDINKEELVVPTTEPELTLREIDIKAIDTLPSGKWLIYLQRNEVDETWKILSSAIISGKLPYKAKVSTAKPNPNSTDRNSHVICVYTPNYLFREDVRNCRRILFEMGFKNMLYYKPDIMTLENMYRVTGSRINHRYFG